MSDSYKNALESIREHCLKRRMKAVEAMDDAAADADMQQYGYWEGVRAALHYPLAIADKALRNPEARQAREG